MKHYSSLRTLLCNRTASDCNIGAITRTNQLFSFLHSAKTKYGVELRNVLYTDGKWITKCFD